MQHCKKTCEHLLAFFLCFPYNLYIPSCSDNSLTLPFGFYVKNMHLKTFNINLCGMLGTFVLQKEIRMCIKLSKLLISWVVKNINLNRIEALNTK